MDMESLIGDLVKLMFTRVSDPERVLFRPGAVGPPAYLATAFGGGSRTLSRISTLREAVQVYASAQALDFLARTKNASFPDRKLQVSYKLTLSSRSVIPAVLLRRWDRRPGFRRSARRYSFRLKAVRGMTRLCTVPRKPLIS